MPKRGLVKATVPAVAAIALVMSFAGISCSGETVGGVGLHVAQLFDPLAPGNRGPLVVLDVLPDSAAEAAGVERGDIVIMADGKDLGGRAFDDIIQTTMRGPAGSPLQVTLKRARTRETLVLTLTRKAVKAR